MSRLFILSVVAALVCGVSAASAAENTKQSRVYNGNAYTAQAYHPYNWSGFYVGANLGYGFGGIDSSFMFGGATLATAGVDPKGLVGGVQAGYNWQLGRFVVGLETDYDVSGQKASAAGVDFKYKGFGSVRGRVGYAFDRFMPYVTSGWAYGSGSASGGGASINVHRNGWGYGAGVEMALAGNWSARVEYMHFDLGSMSQDLGGGFTQKTSFDNNVTRLGLNYRF